MDNWKRLSTQADFDNLKKGDVLFFKILPECRWNYHFDVTFYMGKDWFIHTTNEVVFNKKENYYFCIENYINGISRVVNDVYLTDI